MSFVELLTPVEMAEADRLATASGVDSFALMQKAGAAVATAAAKMVGEGEVLVIAGPGNNGGDGFVAAEMLRRGGRAVSVAMLGEAARVKGDAAKALRGFKGKLAPLAKDTDYRTPGLIIDALFGAGLTRPLQGEAARAAEAINASGKPVLAVDLPSGISGETGEVQGAAIRADRTVTFFRMKPGHLLLPGRLHCGITEVAQIGIPDSVLETIPLTTFHNLPALWQRELRWPAITDHKHARGHVFVVSGPASATGAARLAAAGALRIGAGLVTVASPADALLVNAAHLTAIMVRVFEGAGGLTQLLADPRPKAVVVGPANGVGEPTRANAEAALHSSAAVVLDADALSSFAAEREALFQLIKAREKPTVLTPHVGEFGRLFESEASKLERARKAAGESGAIVVLKGPDTIIAAPDDRAAINANAPPDLATAGSGDVLAGMVAGLLALGVAGFEAAAAAVWMHGAAGAVLGRGMIAEDLPGALPDVLRRLEADLR